MSLNNWLAKKEEDTAVHEKYPVIWKSTNCEAGECRASRTSHRWSVPCTTAAGLMTECYDCHKIRIIKTDSDEEIWANKSESEFVKKRLAELRHENPEKNQPEALERENEQL